MGPFLMAAITNATQLTGVDAHFVAAVGSREHVQCRSTGRRSGGT
jgi:hypothetical protein